MEGIFGRDLELTAMEQFLNSTPNWPSAMVIAYAVHHPSGRFARAGVGRTVFA